MTFIYSRCEKFLVFGESEEGLSRCGMKYQNGSHFSQAFCEGNFRIAMKYRNCLVTIRAAKPNKEKLFFWMLSINFVIEVIRRFPWELSELFQYFPIPKFHTTPALEHHTRSVQFPSGNITYKTQAKEYFFDCLWFWPLVFLDCRSRSAQIVNEHEMCNFWCKFRRQAQIPPTQAQSCSISSTRFCLERVLEGQPSNTHHTLQPRENDQGRLSAASHTHTSRTKTHNYMIWQRKSFHVKSHPEIVKSLGVESCLDQLFAQ